MRGRQNKPNDEKTNTDLKAAAKRDVSDVTETKAGFNSGLAQRHESDSAETRSEFWADQLADQLIERAERTNTRKSEALPVQAESEIPPSKLVTCRSGASPSGAKHIGNMFDVMKAFIIYKAVKKRGYPARLVHTYDDRDPLRTIPAKLPDLEGKWFDTKDAGIVDKMQTFLGHPYHRIPDPFDCCNSWAEHFSKVWSNGITALIPENEIEFHSNDVLYGQGKFDPFIETIFKNIAQARDITLQFQKNTQPDYIPFNAVCSNCGKITTKVVGWDLANKTVKYICTGRSLAGKYVISGCGHEGEASWHDGKLAWRFEWPAQWAMFNTTAEPFGKEHAEGSWPHGKVIIERLYNVEAPVPHIYEFILTNNEKMSARIGNAYLVQDMLEIIEPEILVYLYTKRSKKQRNLDMRQIYQLVDDFERVERVFWGVDKDVNEHEKLNAIREYESAMTVIPKHMPLRIEYQFASIVSQLAPDTEHALKMLRASGHIPHDKHLNAEEIATIARRLNIAKRWVTRFSPELTVKINDSIPEAVRAALSDVQTKALKELGHLLERQIDQTTLYNSFYSIASANGIQAKDFFRAVYQVLINKTAGPRLAPFISALGQERVRAILNQL